MTLSILKETKHLIQVIKLNYPLSPLNFVCKEQTEE